MSNRKDGNDFEATFCEELAKYGFWVHNLAQNAAGQPADVIASRNGKAYLIDCKVCSTTKGFDLSRMEDNQDLSMELWKECGNGEGWFAILVDEKIVMLPHILIKAYRNEKSSLSSLEVHTLGKELSKWVAKCK